jgi:hypothetical protein
VEGLTKFCLCIHHDGTVPCHGLFERFAETNKNRTPSSPACTVTSSPRPKSTRDRLSASEGGCVSAHSTASVGTASGPEALQSFPDPANTYTNAWRVVSTGSGFLLPGANEPSMEMGSAAIPSTGPALPQNFPALADQMWFRYRSRSIRDLNLRNDPSSGLGRAEVTLGSEYHRVSR